MESCSQESVRSALRRKALDNDLVSLSSGIYEIEYLIRNSLGLPNRSLRTALETCLELDVRLSVGVSIKPPSALAEISLWISATSSLNISFLFFCREALGLRSTWLCCSLSFSHAIKRIWAWFDVRYL